MSTTDSATNSTTDELTADTVVNDAAGGCGGACGCGSGGCGGGGTSLESPTMDLRRLPEQLRAGALLGVVATLPVGAGVVVVSPDDIFPMLGQLEAQWPGGFTIRVLEEGPELWTVELARVA